MMTNANFNLDKNFHDISSPSDHDRKFIPIYRHFNQEILSRGVTLMRTPPTKLNQNKPNTYRVSQKK